MTSSDELSTRWSMIFHGRDPQSSEYQAAWRYLHGTYGGVIHSYFQRHAPDRVTAQEWTDEFIAGWVEGSLDRATPLKGKFRHYLATALRHFRYRQSDRRRRTAVVDIDALPEQASPEERSQFDASYAASVLSSALAALKAYQRWVAEQGKPNQYHALISRYYFSDAPPTLAELASETGLTAKAVERQLARGRDRLRTEILQQLEQTVCTHGELAEEVRWLFTHSPGALARDLGAT